MTFCRNQRSGSWAIAIALGCGAIELATPRSLHAEEDSATETAAARALAVDGLRLAQAGSCDEAIPKLERAEKLHHSVIVLSRLGECNVNLGRLVEGTEQLRKVLREPLPANPTPALSKAYEHAQTALDAAKPRIGSLIISLGRAAPPDLQLTVDGRAVPPSLVDTELPADPGEHTIEATAPGYLKATGHVSLSSADKRTVSLRLESDPNAPLALPRANDAPVAGVAPPPIAAGAPLESNSGAASPPGPVAKNHTAAYLAWGVGAVGVGVGSAFGLIALKDKHDIVATCGSNSCPADSGSSLDSAKRSGNVSTIAFGVGGVGLLLGTVLYFTVGGDSPATGAVTPAPHFAGLSRARTMIGPSSVQFAADF